MKAIYFECLSGISTDNLLAALLDIGADKDFIIQNLNCLDLPPRRSLVNRSAHAGVSSTTVEVAAGNDGKLYPLTEVINRVEKSPLNNVIITRACAVLHKLLDAETESET